MSIDPSERRLNEPPNGGRRYWLDDPRNVRKIYLGLWMVCGLLLLADAFYKKKVVLMAESWFGFYGIFGFVACVGLVLAAKELRKLLKRDETYYDD